MIKRLGIAIYMGCIVYMVFANYKGYDVGTFPYYLLAGILIYLGDEVYQMYKLSKNGKRK